MPLSGFEDKTYYDKRRTKTVQDMTKQLLYHLELLRECHQLNREYHSWQGPIPPERFLKRSRLHVPVEYIEAQTAKPLI